MSDTPRTNTLLHGPFRNHEGWRNHPFVELSRTLERELVAKDARIAELEKDAARLDWMNEQRRGIHLWEYPAIDIRHAIDAARTAPADNKETT